MYLQLHSVKEPSKNHMTFVFCSVHYRIGFGWGSCTVGFLYISYFRVPFGSWQNLGFGSVHSCWVGFFPICTFAPIQCTQQRTLETISPACGGPEFESPNFHPEQQRTQRRWSVIEYRKEVGVSQVKPSNCFSRIEKKLDLPSSFTMWNLQSYPTQQF